MDSAVDQEEVHCPELCDGEIRMFGWSKFADGSVSSWNLEDYAEIADVSMFALPAADDRGFAGRDAGSCNGFIDGRAQIFGVISRKIAHRSVGNGHHYRPCVDRITRLGHEVRDCLDTDPTVMATPAAQRQECLLKRRCTHYVDSRLANERRPSGLVIRVRFCQRSLPGAC